MPETKYDATLEDHGWQQMLKQLDKHLPVDRGFTRRERQLVWLLLSVMILMGSYIAHLRSLEPSDISPEMPSEMPMYAQQGVVPGAEIGLAGSDQKTSLLQGTGSNDLYLEQNMPRNSMGSFVSSGLSTRQNVAVEGNLISNRTNMPAGAPAWFLKDPYFNDPYVFPQGQLNIPGLAKREPGIRYSWASFDMELPGSDLAGVFYDQPEKRHGFNVMARGVTENGQSYGGMEMAYGYTYHLASQWAIETGLGFHMFSKNGFANALALSSINSQTGPAIPGNKENSWVEERYQYDVTNSEIVNNEVGAEYIMGIVDQLYYTSIPINLSYSWKRMKLYGGFQVSGLLWATNKIRDYSDQYFNTVVLSRTALQKRNYFNRFDMSTQIGVDARLWKQLYFSVGYNHGLIRIVQTDSGKILSESFKDSYESIYGKNFNQRIDYNRYFSLGLKYSF